VTGSLSRYIGPWAPVGTYVFNAFIGPHPSIEDEDHKNFTVTN
jgi:hypothetical protein